MIQSLKRLTQHSAIYGLSDVVGRSLSFLLVPVYTHVLPTEAYGHVALIYAFIGLMNVLFSYGMDSAFLRFYMLEESRKQQTLSTGYLTMLFTSLVLAGLIIAGAPAIDALIGSSVPLTPYIRLSGIILALDALGVIPFARLRAEGRAPLFASLKLAKVMLELAGNYWLVVRQGAGLEGILISNIAGSGITCAALTLLTLRSLSFEWNRSRLAALLKFGIPYIPAGACVILIEMIDRFMLERMTGTEAVGVYNAARKLGVGMLIFVNVFRLAWQPFFLETSKQEDARAIFARVLTYFLLITSGVFLALSLLIDELIRMPVGGYTFFAEAYWGGTGLVPLFLLAYILYGLYVNLTVGIYLEKKTTVLPVITGLAAGVSIVANLAMIPSYGMYGAAAASVLAYTVMVAGLYIVAQRHYPIPYEYARILKITLLCGGLFGVGRLGLAEGMWMAKLGLLAGYPVLLAATGFFNAQERGYVKRRLRPLLS
jgi:O-antigen/teichoic acid export membrane protein